MIKPIALAGNIIRLEPLAEEHRNPLFEIAQDKQIWMFNLDKAYGKKQFESWFNRALNMSHSLPFVVRQMMDDKLIGSTRLYEINLDHKRLTIGYTWYIPSVWGSLVNAESKYLLLCHAFEMLQMNRVEIVTDARNLRSQGAIKKLGATQEGVLRSHMILADGYVRDSIIYSIIKSEWNAVKANLEKRLKK